MNKESATITINGRLYDAANGTPVADAAKTVTSSQQHQGQPGKRAFSDIGPRPSTTALQKPAKRVVPADASLKPLAQQMHQQPQKSQALYRKALKKPTPQKADSHTKSPLISRYGTNHNKPQVSQDQAAKPAAEASHTPEPATTQLHPAVAKALQRQAMLQKQVQSQPHLSGKELKEKLIKERLAEVADKPAKNRKQSWRERQPRLATILTSTLALLVLGGYLTYIHLPDISMRVAASRAGINATMPTYRPDGYSLNGPISYAPGEVAINYKSNTNDSGFRLLQKATNWDSQAVLDNFVIKQTDNYLTYQQQGVTVYTFGNKAAWVNGGQLYTLEGNATLSSEQVLRLATSM